MVEQIQIAEKEQVRNVSGFDVEVAPLLGLGVALTGLVMSFRPRLALFPLALTALTAMFYRDPERKTPKDPHLLYAIADGRVHQIDEFYEHRFLHTDAIRLSTMLSPIDVPVNRSPSSGVVRYLEQTPGAHRLLSDKQTETTNARTTIGIESNWGPILIEHIAGPWTQRMVLRVKQGDTILVGGRLSTVRFGSRTDLIVQRDSLELLVKPGQRLVGGVTPIGRILPL